MAPREIPDNSCTTGMSILKSALSNESVARWEYWPAKKKRKSPHNDLELQSTSSNCLSLSLSGTTRDLTSVSYDFLRDCELRALLSVGVAAVEAEAHSDKTGHVRRAVSPRMTLMLRATQRISELGVVRDAQQSSR